MTSDNLCKWPACLMFSVYNCPGRGKKLSWRSVSLDWVSSRSRSCCRISWRPERNREEQMRNSRYCRHTPTDTRIHAFCPGLSVCVCVSQEERRKAEEDLRRLEQERKQQIYISLKEKKQQEHTHDQQDNHWQQTCKQHTHTQPSVTDHNHLSYI